MPHCDASKRCEQGRRRIACLRAFKMRNMPHNLHRNNQQAMSSLAGSTPGPLASAHLIPRSDVQFDDAAKPLGKGGFGEVFKGMRKGGSQVAVKRLLPGLTAQSRAEFQKEVALMCSMRSEFVVPVHGIVDDSPDQPVLLVMELMHETLHSAYSSLPVPSLWQRVKWLLQAGKGIEFLHVNKAAPRHQTCQHAHLLPGHRPPPATGRLWPVETAAGHFDSICARHQSLSRSACRCNRCRRGHGALHGAGDHDFPSSVQCGMPSEQ